MKVQDITTCNPATDLAAVAMMMWNKDCGVVPVTDEQGKPVGMITDRDISIAGATQRRPLSEIPVSAVKDGGIVACEADRDVRDAMRLMADARVRRLPVIDGEGRLVGVLSMGDVVANVPGSGDGSSPSAELPYEDVINVLKEIYVHH